MIAGFDKGLAQSGGVDEEGPTPPRSCGLDLGGSSRPSELGESGVTGAVVDKGECASG
jgi:hypothetical protein